MADLPLLRRWFRAWRAAWHAEPVTMSSDLPIEVVRERLRARTVGYRQAAFRGGVRYGVLGRIGDHDIEVEAGYIAIVSLRRPRMSARLEPTATGTRVDGSIRRILPLMWYATAFLGLTSVVFVLVLGWNVVYAVGAGQFTADQLLVCALPVPAALVLAGLSLLGSTFGRREVTYLKSWLAECLQTAEGGTVAPTP